MASHKNHPEGIALLSIYADDEEDEDMDDVTHSPFEQPQKHQPQPQTPQTLVSPENANNYSNEVVAVADEAVTTIEEFKVVETDEFALRVSGSDRGRKGTLTIVDYAHDENHEMVMSPEPEEGEILTTGRVTYGEELQVATGELPETTSPQTVQGPSPNMRASPPQSSDRNDLQKPNTIVFESGPVETEEDIILASGDSKEVDPLAAFLPPLSKEMCSEELQVKIERFLNLKRSGKSYNAEVRKKKEYRNPDFLLHAVTYQDIDQIGSCFKKDVFDPHGYDESDFYDALEADMRRELERKEQERKKSPKVDFVSGGSQPGIVIPTPKLNLPITAGNLPLAAAVGGTDGRANKKSKWDKVDGDTKNSLPAGAQDAISAVLQSAANAGGGYSAFAQQRRREAEDKRSERKLEKRS